MTKASARTALMLATILTIASCGDSTEGGPPTSQSIDVPVTYHIDPPMPRPEIAELSPVGPDAVVEVEWSRLALPVGPEGGYVQYESVFSLAGRFFMVGIFFPDFDAPTEEISEEELNEQYEAYRAGIRPVVWSSVDGSVWDEVDLGYSPPVEYLQSVVVGDGVLIVGTVWDSPTGPYSFYFRSPDGVTWEHDVIEGLNGAFSVASSGMIDGHIVAVGMYMGFDGIEDVSVEKDGLVFTRSWSEERVTVVGDGGAVLFDEDIGWLDQFAAQTNEGLRIFDPDSGEVLMVLPDDLAIDDGTLVYESNGYRIEADYREDPGSFRLTDAGGEEVMAGTLDDLWSAGTITVPDGSGGVLMVVTFAELRDAENLLYDRQFEESQRVFALIEREDGGWDEVELDLGGSDPYGGMAAGDAGLVLASQRWTGEATTTEFRRTADGRSWALLTSLDRPLQSVSPLAGGYLAVGDAGAGGAALFASDDGVAWEPVLVVHGSVGSTVSPGLAAGTDGALVVMSEFGGGGGPVVLDAGGVEMFVEGDFVSIRQQDDDMVFILLEGFVEDLFGSGGLQEAGDTIEILVGGEVIGAVDADALDEAMASYDPEASLRQSVPLSSVFLTRDGRSITRLTGDVFGTVTIQNGAVTGNTIVLLGFEAEPIDGEFGFDYVEFDQDPVLLIGVVS